MLVAFGLAACGGGDGGADAEKSRRAGGAEDTVRGYLKALVAGRGGDACAKFTAEYQRALMRQNREFARSKRARDCAGLMEALTRATPSVTFEGRPLKPDTVGKLKLKASVVRSGAEYKGVVTGVRGMQRYEVETRGGRWLITGIERTR